MDNRWLLPLVAVVAVMAGVLAVLLSSNLLPINLGRNSKVAPIASPVPEKPVGTAKLTIVPETLVVNLGSTVSAEIQMEGQNEEISAVDLRISFDPKLVSIEEITAGDFLSGASELDKDIDDNTGKATYVLGTLQARANTGVVAIVKFKGIKEGESKVGLTESRATSINKDGNVIVDIKSATIAVRE